MKKYLLIAFLILSGCQDHHFVPIENADDIKLPEFGNSGMQKSFTETSEKAQKEVMSESYRGDRKPEAQNVLIASGLMELGDKQKGRDFKDFSIYVIAWSTEKKVAPVAVSRYKVKKFPFTYRLAERDLMAAKLPDNSTELVIEARLDRDGDPISKDPGDVFGYSKKKFTIGDSDVNVVLDRDR